MDGHFTLHLHGKTLSMPRQGGEGMLLSFHTLKSLNNMEKYK